MTINLTAVLLVTTIVLALLFGVSVAALDYLDIRRLRTFERRLEDWQRMRSPEMQRAWLSHPRHKPRCECRRYGLPFMDVVLDNSGTHTRDRCGG